LPEINAAVAFHSTGQYRSEINMSRVLLGRVYRRRGEFAEVHKLLDQILREGEAAGDRSKVSDVVGEIANAYAVQEKFADALRHFERRLELLRNSKAVADIGYSLTGKAAMLLHLGALNEATAALDEAKARAGSNEGVARRVRVLHNDLLYRKGQWSACAAAYSQALKESQPSSEERIAAVARQIECLVFAGKNGEAQRIAVAWLPALDDMKGSQSAACMRAAFALVESQPAKFQKPLNEAIDHFRTREQFESLWMAESVAAAAFHRCGDAPAAQAHTQASMTAWKNLESRIPGEYLQKYRLLPWVVHYQRMRI
jgi:tetratricopeptide (TPR) repeat protein